MSVTATRFRTIQTNDYPALLEHLKTGKRIVEGHGAQRLA